MVDNMNKKRIIITVVLLIAAIVLIAGLSYAFYAPEIDKNIPSSSELVTPYLSLNVIDGNEINIEHVLPGQKVIKTFSVQNTGTGSITYQVALTDVLNELVRYPDLVYTITSTNNGGSVTNQIFPTTDALLLHDVEIAPNTTQEYTMEITFKNLDLDQSIDCDKTIAGTIQIYDQYAPKIYGVKKDITSSTTTFLRTRDSVGLVANAQVGNNLAVNDFDSIYPWSDIVSYNYDLTTQKEVGIYGDDNFKFDGSNGMVLTYIPAFYYHRYRDGNYEYIEISRDYVEGFSYSAAFSVSRYHVGWNGTNLTSQSGAYVKTNQLPAWYRNQAYALGPNFTQFDHRLFNIYMLFLVEYANYDSQMVLGRGIVELSSGNRVLLKEAINTNSFVISNSWHMKVGYYVHIISTTSDKSQEEYFVKITNIEDYNDGNITGRLITLDHEPISLPKSYAIRLAVLPSGLTDQYGMKSGYYSDSVIGSAQPNIYRGIENIYGNAWTYVDGINFKNMKAYVCNNPREYADNKYNGCYQETGVILPSNGGINDYFSSLSYDSNYSKIMVASAFGGSASTYIGDQALTWGGNHPLIYGGDFGSSGNIVGLFRINSYDSQQASLTRGARIILDHN